MEYYHPVNARNDEYSFEDDDDKIFYYYNDAGLKSWLHSKGVNQSQDEYVESVKSFVKDFKEITKAGLAVSVVFSSVAGYLLGVYDFHDLNWITLLMLVVGLSPMLAPTIGGYVTEDLGWHAVFFILMCMGIAILIASQIGLPNTYKPDKYGSNGSLHGNACFTGWPMSWRTIHGYCNR